MQGSSRCLPLPISSASSSFKGKAIEEMTSRGQQITGSVGARQRRMVSIKTLQQGYPHLRFTFDPSNKIAFVNQNSKLLPSQTFLHPRQPPPPPPPPPQKESSSLIQYRHSVSSANFLKTTNSFTPFFSAIYSSSTSADRLCPQPSLTQATRQSQCTEQSDRCETLPTFVEIIGPHNPLPSSVVSSTTSTLIRNRSLPSNTTITQQIIPTSYAQGGENSDTLQFTRYSLHPPTKHSNPREEKTDGMQYYKTSTIMFSQFNKPSPPPPPPSSSLFSEATTILQKSTAIPLIRARRMLKKSLSKPALNPFQLSTPPPHSSQQIPPTLQPQQLPLETVRRHTNFLKAKSPFKGSSIPNLVSSRYRNSSNDDFSRLSTEGLVSFNKTSSTATNFHSARRLPESQNLQKELIPSFKKQITAKLHQLQIVREADIVSASNTPITEVMRRRRRSRQINDSPPKKIVFQVDAAVQNDYTVTRQEGFAHSKNDEDSDLEMYMHLCDG